MSQIPGCRDFLHCAAATAAAVLAARAGWTSHPTKCEEASGQTGKTEHVKN